VRCGRQSSSFRTEIDLTRFNPLFPQQCQFPREKRPSASPGRGELTIRPPTLPHHKSSSSVTKHRVRNLVFKQLPQQFRCGSLVAPSLRTSPSSPIARHSQDCPARNRHCHLIEMPLRRWPRASTAKFSGEQWPELQHPWPHRLVGDIQTALREQILDVAIAEHETEMEPNGMPDDRRRKLMARKRDRHAPSYQSNGQGSLIAFQPQAVIGSCR
jgi:hypothetical protein